MEYKFYFRPNKLSRRSYQAIDYYQLNKSISYYFSFILLALSFCSITAQSTGNQTNRPNEEAQIKEILGLLKEVRVKKNDDLYAALELIKIANQKAEHITDRYTKIRCRADLSLIYFLMERFEESACIIDEVLPIYETEFSQKYSKIASLYSRRGKIAFYNGDYQGAEEYLLGAEKYQSIAQSQKSAGMTLLYLSDLHIQQSDFVKALEYTYKALQKFKMQPDYTYESAAITSLGEINYLITDYQSARSHFEEVLSQKDSISNPQFLIRPLIFMGMLESDEGHVEAAILHLSEALEVANTIGSTPELARVYQYLCKIELSQGHTAKAAQYLIQAKEAADKSNLVRYQKENSLYATHIAMVDNKQAESLPTLLNSYQWAKENDDFYLAYKASELIGQVHQSLGAPTKALSYYQTSMTAKESYLNNTQMMRASAEKWKNEIKLNEKERTLSEENLNIQLSAKKNLNRILSICSLLLLGLVIALWFISRSRSIALQELKGSNESLVQAQRDIKEQNKELEKYIESNIQLQEFAHIASHDLKTPLRTIGSYAGLLKKKLKIEPKSKESEYFGFIEKSTKELFDFINNLLKYSEVNSQKLDVDEIKINSFFKTIMSRFKADLKQKGVAISTGDMPKRINADEVKLLQVFQNIINNAIKFRDPAKDSWIKISHKESTQYNTFVISDNGIGIDEKYLPQVFNAYYRVNRKDDYEGVGLGLSICKTIIEKHGGEISIQSRLGQGSSVRFTIAKEI